MKKEDIKDFELASSSTIKGISLIGVVAFTAYIGYKFWNKSRSTEASPIARKVVVPVNLPEPKKKSKKK